MKKETMKTMTTEKPQSWVESKALLSPRPLALAKRFEVKVNPTLTGRQSIVFGCVLENCKAAGAFWIHPSKIASVLKMELETVTYALKMLTLKRFINHVSAVKYRLFFPQSNYRVESGYSVIVCDDSFMWKIDAFNQLFGVTLSELEYRKIFFPTISKYKHSRKDMKSIFMWTNQCSNYGSEIGMLYGIATSYQIWQKLDVLFTIIRNAFKADDKELETIEERLRTIDSDSFCVVPAIIASQYSGELEKCDVLLVNKDYREYLMQFSCQQEPEFKKAVAKVKFKMECVTSKKKDAWNRRIKPDPKQNTFPI